LFIACWRSDNTQIILKIELLIEHKIFRLIVETTKIFEDELLVTMQVVSINGNLLGEMGFFLLRTFLDKTEETQSSNLKQSSVNKHKRIRSVCKYE
jgi:hypothetical protein